MESQSNRNVSRGDQRFDIIINDLQMPIKFW